MELTLFSKSELFTSITSIRHKINTAATSRANFCDAIFLKTVASPVRGENHPCNQPRTGDVEFLVQSDQHWLYEKFLRDTKINESVIK